MLLKSFISCAYRFTPNVGVYTLNVSLFTFDVFLERARGFEPLTTCLGSKDSTTELRPLADSNPTLALYPKSRNRVF